MKALSLWQPWASAIACGAKRIETRSWSTNYRGPLLLHAGLSANAKLWPDVHQCLDSRCLWKSVAESSGWTRDPSPHIASQLNNWLHRLPRGALIAVAELVDCCPITMRNGVGLLCPRGQERQEVSEQETALCDFTPGRFGWVLANVRAFPTPIPYRGRQGLFEVPASALTYSAVIPREQDHPDLIGFGFGQDDGKSPLFATREEAIAAFTKGGNASPTTDAPEAPAPGQEDHNEPIH